MLGVSLDIIAVLNLTPSERGLRVIRSSNRPRGSASTSTTGRQFFI